MKKRVLFLLLLLTVSTVLCGCSGSKKKGEADNQNPSSNGANSSGTGTGNSGDLTSTGKPVYGGSIIVGITQDLDSLDPHKAEAAGTEEVLFNIFEGLVKPDQDGNLVPAVASKYSMSEDCKTYDFILREGVTFHNGTPVTADDVIYSLKRCAGLLEVSDPEVLTVSALSCIQDITEFTADDGSTGVRLTLNEPNSELIGYLTCSIIPKDYDNMEKIPVGTGPFRFVSYTPLQSMVMEKNEDYYLEGVPYLDQVTFKISANTDTAFLELMAGSIDIFPYLTGEQAKQLPESFSIIRGSMNLVQALFLNNAAKPFDDMNVRKSLFYAIDPEQILAMVGDGGGKVIRSNAFPGFAKYFNNELEGTYLYDVEKAKTLLADAGYPNGFTFTIKVPSNYQYHVDTAQVVVEQLKQAGITANIQLIEWSSWLSEVYRSRDFEATIVGLDANLAPSDMLKRYHSDASGNFVNYKNDEYDNIYEKAVATVDDQEKVRLYKDLQRVLNEDAASVYIQAPPLLIAINKKLSGYVFYPVYVQDMSTVFYTE